MFSRIFISILESILYPLAEVAEGAWDESEGAGETGRRGIFNTSSAGSSFADMASGALVSVIKM